MIQWNDEDLRQMKRIEVELTRTLLPHASTTEASLAVFALVRCARVLLRKYPEKTQDTLRRVLVDFLEGRTGPRDAPEERLILSPEFTH